MISGIARQTLTDALHKCSSITLCWSIHSTKKPVTTMLTYPWKCTVLHCNHLGNTWKPLVLMTRHFDYCPSTSEGDNQSVRSSAPVVSRCFPGGYNVKLYISRGRLAWWLLAFLHSDISSLVHLSCASFSFFTLLKSDSEGTLAAVSLVTADDPFKLPRSWGFCIYIYG